MKNELIEFSYYNDLYDLYKNLLTNKQKEIADKYFIYNLSLSEIASDLDVSRSAINDLLKRVKLKLDNYEKKLKLNKKLENIKEEINKLNLNEETKKKLIEVIYNGI